MTRARTGISHRRTGHRPKPAGWASRVSSPRRAHRSAVPSAERVGSSRQVPLTVSCQNSPSPGNRRAHSRAVPVSSRRRPSSSRTTQSSLSRSDSSSMADHRARLVVEGGPSITSRSIHRGSTRPSTSRSYHGSVRPPTVVACRPATCTLACSDSPARASAVRVRAAKPDSWSMLTIGGPPRWRRTAAISTVDAPEPSSTTFAGSRVSSSARRRRKSGSAAQVPSGMCAGASIGAISAASSALRTSRANAAQRPNTEAWTRPAARPAIAASRGRRSSCPASVTAVAVATPRARW